MFQNLFKPLATETRWFLTYLWWQKDHRDQSLTELPLYQLSHKLKRLAEIVSAGIAVAVAIAADSLSTNQNIEVIKVITRRKIAMRNIAPNLSG